MPIIVQCPGCGGKFRAPDHLALKQVKCPKCSGVIEVGRVVEEPAGQAGRPVAKAAAPAAPARISPPSPPRPAPAVSTRFMPVAPAAPAGLPPMLPSRAPPPWKRTAVVRKRKLLVWCGLGVGAVVLACVVLTVFSRWRGGSGERLAQGFAASKTLPALPAKIEGDARVRVVSARLNSGSESLTYPWTGTLRVWSLRLVLQNEGATDLVSGNVSPCSSAMRTAAATRA